jgi:alpha/beta superfamily hydrolase
VEQSVWIDAPRGRLEGVLQYPSGAAAARAILVLPPHPGLGGDLDNNVIRAVAAAAVRRGAAVLRINYHGIGRSASATGDPLGDFRYWSRVLAEDAYDLVLDDARAAFGFLHDLSGREVHVVGYSFGAGLALRLASEPLPVGVVVAIALRLGKDEASLVSGARRGVYALHGERDTLTPLAPLLAVLSGLDGLDGLDERFRLEVLAGADHFFRDREDEVARRACDFIFLQAATDCAPGSCRRVSGDRR